MIPPRPARSTLGGPGVIPGATYGADVAFFESVHGAAPKYAGRDRANPTAFILSAAALLCHLGEQAAGDAVECAVREVIAEGRTVTADLGGTAGTSEMADAVAARCT